MIDPVKKNEELRNLTESIFRNIFKSRPAKTLPSAQAAQNAERFRQAHGTNYIIKNGPKNKYYTGSDLVKLYINKQINNDTELKVFNSKKPFFRFISLMKREPFASALKDYYRDDNDSPDPNTSYFIAVPNAMTRKYETKKATIMDIVDDIRNDPNLQNKMKVYDSKKEQWQLIQSSELWMEILALST